MSSIEIAGAAETIFITTGNMGIANEWLRGVANLDTPDLTGRQYSGKFGNQRLVIVSNKDMPTLVGRFDGCFGLWGSDQALEDRVDRCTWENLGLPVGVRFGLLGPEDYELDGDSKVLVATSYPKAFERYLNQCGPPFKTNEVLYVRGKAEGLPDLTDLVFDLFQTGRSAEANGLKVIEFSPEVVTLGGLYRECRNAS